MKAVITGATGFLGSHLLKTLINKNIYDKISIITRDPAKFDKIFEFNGIEVIKGDIREKESLNNVFMDTDIVFHLAAYVDSWPKNPRKGYYQTNVKGTLNVLESANNSNVKKVVYCSSYFALGDTLDNMADETWNNPPNFKHPYANTKYEAGQEVDNINDKYDFELITVNPTVIIGLQMDNPVSKLLHEYINKKLIGLPKNGSSLMNFVSVDDVVEGIILASEKGKSGEKYILGSENLSLNEFLMKFGDLLGYSKPRSIPIPLVKSYGLFLESIPFIKPKYTRADFEVAFRNWQYDSSKAQQQLGYKPKPINPKDYLSFLVESNGLRKKIEKKG